MAQDSCLGDTGCSSGSMRTSLHTSLSIWAVRSRISLCLIVVKPPLAQESVCSTVKLLPQSHFRGCLDGVQRIVEGEYVHGCVQGEAMVLEGKNCEPSRGALLLGKINCPQSVVGQAGGCRVHPHL